LLSYDHVREGDMLQFYFLSISANLISGMILSSDWLSLKLESMADLLSSLSTRRGKMVSGLAAILVGLGTLFVPAAPPLVIGDLFPSLMGMAMGIALLFEAFKQDAVFPTERVEGHAEAEKVPFVYRTSIGMLGLAAAILHFFLPERPFL
jgi:hypothetical protein